MRDKQQIEVDLKLAREEYSNLKSVFYSVQGMFDEKMNDITKRIYQHQDELLEHYPEEKEG